MPIPSTASLAEQLHCLSHDGKVVITAQRWTDSARPADRPRTWLRLVRNGKIVQDAPFAGLAAQQGMKEFWAGLAERYAPTSLDEDQMWKTLRELAGIEQNWCLAKDCSGSMPVAWWVCPLCHRDARRVALGGLITARTRGVLTLDLRNA